MKKFLVVCLLLTACASEPVPADFADVPCELMDLPEQVDGLSYQAGQSDVDGYEWQKTGPEGQRFIGTSYTCKASYLAGEDVLAVDVLVDQVSAARYERAQGIVEEEFDYILTLSESELEQVKAEHEGVSYQFMVETHEDPAQLSDVFAMATIFFEEDGLFVTLYGFNTLRVSQEPLPELQKVIEAIITNHGK